MKNIQLVFSMTVIALGIALIAAMSMGRYPIHLSTIAKLPFFIFGGAESNALTGQTILVLWSVRLPRMLMALMTGAALAVAGVVFQGLFKNPLSQLEGAVQRVWRRQPRPGSGRDHRL